MQKKQISIGQVSKLTGLTIRTLQHYDKIGVLRASGRTEGGRRYYIDRDLAKLEHIVFYRSIGFSLEQIKEILRGVNTAQGVADLLSHQEQLLYNQLYKLQNSIAAISACQEIAETGKAPPWTLLAAFMQSLSKVNLSMWKDAEFSEEQKRIFQQDIQTFDDVMEFYNTWRRLSIKAAAYSEAGISADAPIAHKLAAEWETMIVKLTHGNAEHINAYLEVDRNRDMWDPAEQELVEKAEPYLNEILALHNKHET